MTIDKRTLNIVKRWIIKEIEARFDFEEDESMWLELKQFILKL